MCEGFFTFVPHLNLKKRIWVEEIKKQPKEKDF